MALLYGIPLVILCLLLEGFFAGTETGFISCDRIRMANRADNNDKRAKIVLSFLNDPERFLATTLVGVNISIITGSSVATMIVSHYIRDPGRAAVVATLIVLPLILIFGETVPKIFYRQHADTMALFAAYPLKIASRCVGPLTFLVTGASRLISRVFSGKLVKKNPYVTREEIRLLLLQAAKQGVIDMSDIDVSGEIFDFAKTSVSSVMVPLKHVISAQDVFSVKNVKELIGKSGYSRIPVYSGSEDNITGIVEMSDLVCADAAGKDIKELARPPYIVQEDRCLGDVLKDFQVNGKNVAVVVDKNAKALGIATIEDIVEEIFGEIEDEYDIAETSLDGDFKWS